MASNAPSSTATAAAAGIRGAALATPAPRLRLRPAIEEFKALSAADPAAYRHVLFLRFVLINVIAFGLLGAAWVRGWVDTILAGDMTQLVLVIAGVFLVGLAGCAWRVWQTSAELSEISDPQPGSLAALYLDNARRRDGQSRALSASALKLALSARIAAIRQLATSLVLLGLIGTVIGFIIALSGVDPDAVADVSAVGPIVSTLISGMSVALYTTLVGAVLNIWLMLNYRLLEQGTVNLVTSLVELGEQHAQS